MKVKVSYTVGLDDVPELAEELLASARRDLDDCISKLKFRPNNLEKMTADYKSVSEKMDIVADQAMDVLNITSGWVAAATPQASPPDIVLEEIDAEQD